MCDITRRIVDAAVAIVTDHEPGIEYQHGLFCQVALPRKRQEGQFFERSFQNGTVKIYAGELWDGRKAIPQPLPYGVKPRLALIHINTEAVRKKSPIIDIGSSASEFLRRLGFDDGGYTYAHFKKQLMALSAARFWLGFTAEDRAVTIDAKPIKRFDAWVTNAVNPVLWPGVMELSKDYFESLLEHAVPLDNRALRALAHSALALDVYSFLARRLYSIKKPIKIPWLLFKEQFGQEYNDLKDFKREFQKAMRAALTVYPSAKVEQVTGGLVLHPSVPPVHSTAVAVSPGLADPVRRSLPAPTAASLQPPTVERFRERYPRLDVYACKSDFDAWLTGKKSQPTDYDKAFLGFARKWVKRKV